MPALLVMTALGFAGYSLLLPTAPLWATRGGADEAGAGLVNAVLMAATVLAQLLVGPVLARLGWRAVLVAGLILLGLPSIAFTLGDGLPWILGLSTLRGLGFGILTVCGSSAVAELSSPSDRGRAVGRYGLAIAIPQFFLIPTSAWMADSLPFWLVFLLGAAPLLGVPFALILGRILDAKRDTTDAGDAGGGTRRAAAGTALLLLLPSLALLAVTAPGGAILSFAPQFVPGAGWALLGLALFTGVAAVGRWLAGAAADRRSPFALVPVGLAIGALGLVLAALSLVGPGRTGWLLAGLALAGVAYGAVQTLTLVAAFALAGPRRDLASTVWNIGFDAGTGVGSLVVGLVAAGSSFATGLGVMAAFAGAVLLLSAASAPALRRRATA